MKGVSASPQKIAAAPGRKLSISQTFDYSRAPDHLAAVHTFLEQRRWLQWLGGEYMYCAFLLVLRLLTGSCCLPFAWNGTLNECKHCQCTQVTAFFCKKPVLKDHRK